MLHLSKKLREARTERSMRQSQLAELLGVAQNTVSAWERGTAKPDVSTVIKIAQIFSMDPAYFINEDAILQEPPVSYGNSDDPHELREIIARIRSMCGRLQEKITYLENRLEDKEKIIIVLEESRTDLQRRISDKNEIKKNANA